MGYHCREIVKRMVANRLMTLVSEAEDSVNAMKSSDASRHIYDTVSLNQIQSLLFDAMIDECREHEGRVAEQELLLRERWSKMEIGDDITVAAETALGIGPTSMSGIG